MDPLTSAAASGMRTSLQSLDMLANNLANVQTNGYKLDREFYDLYTSADAVAGGDYDPTRMPDIVKNWTDYSQGTLQQTSNQLDFAISGQGFFAVNGPNKTTLYTRDGSFHLNATGQLVTHDGYTVRARNGNPVQLDPAQPISVDTTGMILQAGQNVAQLQLASFGNSTELTKQGATYFQFGGQPNEIQTATGEVQQGKVEGSNVTPAESTVRLVNVMRQFEMLQKAMSIGSDMNRQSIEEVARSGQ
jgi:flagellar basal-body rod protein FlgF